MLLIEKFMKLFKRKCKKESWNGGRPIRPLNDNEIKKGKKIKLDKVANVKVVWANDELMQVEYDDLSRKLLRKDAYLKTNQ